MKKPKKTKKKKRNRSSKELKLSEEHGRKFAQTIRELAESSRQTKRERGE